MYRWMRHESSKGQGLQGIRRQVGWRVMRIQEKQWEIREGDLNGARPIQKEWVEGGEN